MSFAQPNIHYRVRNGLLMASVLLSISADHILTSQSFKIQINTIANLPIFPPTSVLASGITVKNYWPYFLSVTRTTLLTHLVFDTTYRVFRNSRHWVVVSFNFRRKILVITSTDRIDYEVWYFENETFTVCRIVCDHLPSNVASCKRRKVALFIPLRKPANSRNCMNLSPN